MAKLTWRKSSRSNSIGSCVEVAARPGVRYVRDSTDPSRGMLEVEEEAFAAFIGAVKGGTYDLHRRA